MAGQSHKPTQAAGTEEDKVIFLVKQFQSDSLSMPFLLFTSYASSLTPSTWYSMSRAFFNLAISQTSFNGATQNKISNRALKAELPFAFIFYSLPKSIIVYRSPEKVCTAILSQGSTLSARAPAFLLSDAFLSRVVSVARKSGAHAYLPHTCNPGSGCWKGCWAGCDRSGSCSCLSPGKLQSRLSLGFF